MENSGGEVQRSLRAAPSPEGWKAEIRSVLDGERLDYLERLGSAAEYVEVQLINSAHPSRARSAVTEALEDIAMAWDPEGRDAPDRVASLIDLIKAYRPPVGFGRLATFVAGWSQSGDLDETRQALVQAALFGLDAYFPAPPLSASEPQGPTMAAFRGYVDLLEGLIGTAAFTVYAVRTLMSLHIYGLDDEFLHEAIENYPFCIRGVLLFILEKGDSTQAGRLLTRLFEFCVGRPGLVRRFQIEWESLGGTMSDRNGVQLTLPRGQVLPPLSLGIFANVQYLRTLWEGAEFESTIEELAAAQRTRGRRGRAGGGARK
jgi:hypothetical protein